MAQHWAAAAETLTRADAPWIEGMDSCIRGLRYALQTTTAAGALDADLSYIENEIDAITDHWTRLRGPIPEETT